MRKIKLNDVNVYLGNAAQENIRLAYAQSIGCDVIQLYGLRSSVLTNPDLPLFIQKARTTYGITDVAAIMSSENGFNNALAYNVGKPANQQFNEFNMENEFWFGMRVDFDITNAVVGYTYTIDITSGTFPPKSYSYTAVGGDTDVSIAANLLAVMNANPVTNFLYKITATVGMTIIQVYNRNDLREFTYSNSGSNMNSYIVNMAFKQWTDMAFNLKTNIGLNGWKVSAYIANPYNNWGLTEATSMIADIDEFECTLYRSTPNEMFSPFRVDQLFNLANAGALAAKVVDFTPLFSAEAAYMHTFLYNATIAAPAPTPLVAAEPYWTNMWNVDSFPNKASLNVTGFTYFDYKSLATLPTVIIL